MLHRTLYKRDSKGNVREWRIEQEGNRYRTVAGLADGEQVTSGWTTAEGKNIGRSNETSAEEQATSQVESLYEKKLKVDYHETLDSIDEDKIYKPMLAVDWNKRKDKIDFTGGVYVQPKLDGIRCIANAKGLWSRTGKPIVAVPHIWEMLAPVFEAHPDAVIDGELYNHDLKHDFNEIISIVRRTKCSREDYEKSRRMAQYHVYDCASAPGDFLDRYNFLKELAQLALRKNNDIDLHNSVQLVETTQAHSIEDVDIAYGIALEDGFEGGIIRLNAPYQQKRSNNLLKRKDFEDAEFEIVEILEGNGNWAGIAKRLVFRLPEPVLIDGEWVNTCGAGIAGKKEVLEEVFQERELYVGEQVTVQYFTKTPAGMPRFPIAKALHKDKRW